MSEQDSLPMYSYYQNDDAGDMDDTIQGRNSEKDYEESPTMPLFMVFQQNSSLNLFSGPLFAVFLTILFIL